MVLGQFVNYAAAAFALAAGVLWLKSALVPTPQYLFVTATAHQSPEYGSVGVSTDNSGLMMLAEALKKQSRWSSAAAICASVAAILTAIGLSIPASY
jgi:hypothetical protein